MGLGLDDIKDFIKPFLFHFQKFLILIGLILCFGDDYFFYSFLIVENGYKEVGFEICQGLI